MVEQSSTGHATASSSFSHDKWFRTIMNKGGHASTSSGHMQLKIPKIPKMFRDIVSNNDANGPCYNPRMVSIGPCHHGKPKLEAMEKHKIKMAKQHMKRTFTQGRSIQDLYKKVKEVTHKARICSSNYYDSNQSTLIDDESFTRIMFLVYGENLYSGKINSGSVQES